MTGELNQVRVSGVECASTPEQPAGTEDGACRSELARYKVDIAALSETRFSEQGQLDEVCADYTFFWSGRSKAKRRDAGVAFAI
ncbi:unnamed protein product [Schistocephalus solidus]|uniref:Uncharacterized protein n=1 Tax=Schistocephalus solidus TaxID=70667 RepID=A0A183STL2_SCHSO|nr:unnamed protein product [Schistocephalus solidus]